MDITDHKTTPLLGKNTAMQPVEKREQRPAEGDKNNNQGKTPKNWRLFKRKVPQLLQMSEVECGAACLAMILSYFGRKTSVSEIREHCGIGRDGMSALDITKAARSYGMRVRAISLKENDFRFVKLPAIVHWEFNHFIIVENWSTKGVDVVDPASGRKRLTVAEFDEGFTGVVIMLEPGVHFVRHTAPKQVRLQSYIVAYLKQAPAILLQILGASLILQLFGLIVPIFTKVIVDQVIPYKLNDVLLLLGVGIIVVVLSQAVVTFLRSILLIFLQAHIDIQFMLSSIEHLLSLPQQYFLRHSSGDIMARLGSNGVIRDLVSSRLISTVLDGSLVIAYLFILLTQSSVFALLVVIIGLLQVIMLLFTASIVRRLSMRELEATGKTQGYVAEALAGVTTIKAAGAEQRAFQQWSNLFFDQLNISNRRSYFSSFIDLGMGTLRTISPLALLWIGTTQVLSGRMQLGTMLALNALAGAFLTPIASLVGSGQQLFLVQSHLDRIADIMEAEPEQDIQRTQTPPRLTGNVKLEHISFQYDPNAPKVLNDINLVIEPGQKVALVGRTGSGKSTLGKLLLGLYLPTEGEILYDGIPLRFLNYQAVRAQFGVVMQESSIFSGSVRQNICFNNPDLGMEQIVKAAQAAALHEDIMIMPMGYETFVSEGGSALSGGQRQRLAIARALANAPALLLLDEATSSLDVVTERIVDSNLKALACTQIIIAHRLSTIRNADMILVLDQGTIMERGTHQELLRRNGYYARLIQSQLASGEVRAV